jgi:hypothetical protein
MGDARGTLGLRNGVLHLYLDNKTPERNE